MPSQNAMLVRAVGLRRHCDRHRGGCGFSIGDEDGEILHAPDGGLIGRSWSNAETKPSYPNEEALAVALPRRLHVDAAAGARRRTRCSSALDARSTLRPPVRWPWLLDRWRRRRVPRPGLPGGGLNRMPPNVEISGRQNWRVVCECKPRDCSGGPSESPLLGACP